MDKVEEEERMEWTWRMIWRKGTVEDERIEDE